MTKIILLSVFETHCSIFLISSLTTFIFRHIDCVSVLSATTDLATKDVICIVCHCRVSRSIARLSALNDSNSSDLGVKYFNCQSIRLSACVSYNVYIVAGCVELLPQLDSSYSPNNSTYLSSPLTIRNGNGVT